LGDEAVLYAINEAQARTILVSSLNALKIARILDRCKTLRMIVWFTSQEFTRDDQPSQQLKNKDTELPVINFQELLHRGEKSGERIFSISHSIYFSTILQFLLAKR
uniref:SIS domain-containing protein n=1 Tax=Gongylonema pulchrum TaxID=637853 RepID=A0A183DFM8_9BILA